MSSSRRLPLLRVLASALACLGLAACAGYQPGAAPAPPFRSLGLSPVTVEAFAPQSGPLLHRQLAEAFLRAPGDLRLTSPDQAEAVLSVTLVGYDRQLRATRSDDTGLGRSFDLTLTAEVTLRSRDGTTLWLDRVPVTVSDPAYTAANLPESEYQLLPVLADRLALRIRDRVLLHF